MNKYAHKLLALTVILVGVILLSACDLKDTFKSGNTQTTMQQAAEVSKHKSQDKPPAKPTEEGHRRNTEPALDARSEDDKLKKPQASENSPAASLLKIRFASEGGLPPFNTLNENGELAGFDIDIGKALCKELKAQCSFVIQSWDGILAGLISQKYDAVLASMSVSADRLKVVDFTDKYYSNKLAFIGRAGTKFEDLSNKRIGAQQSTVAALYLQKNHPKAKMMTFATQSEAYAKLQADELDLVLTDQLPAYHWLGSEQGHGFALIGAPLPVGEDVAIAVRRDEPLKEQLNGALAAIIQSGEYAKISRQYFSFDIYAPSSLPAQQAEPSPQATP